MTIEQVLEVITGNTIAVMTRMPEKKEAWLQGLSQLLSQFKSQGLDELAVYTDICRRLVEGISPDDLTPQVPGELQQAWQEILTGISGKNG